MIQLKNVSKKFNQEMAIHDVSISIQKGEIYGLIGPSGAGKSTLLRTMNLLERPTTGEILIEGQNLMHLSNGNLREARKSIGMIFQQFNLVANQSVFKNIEIALQLANYPKSERQSRVEECLRFVGLEAMQHKYPAQLSGGQKQRVAIARAIANNPTILLCDEPTSSLDPSTTNEILSVLQSINQTFGVTIVIVSHEMDVIKSICTRVSVLSDGQLYDTIDITPTGIHSIEAHPQSFVDALRMGDE
ncbi:ABC transporter [Solibacillus sp. R5-41]|uniref:methionine ABC transporter ATP-binding protein n=1 Tax=Solibacillus sp. R5-41 TaxID=2048654 RepID=UPI000C12720B|nr:ATP-binding cassette domain-containing protein [Solibacillus sp. R5-41]ATP40302.1 ABC transporter [Solibacillus sp. R5-41]